jgi:multidrug resistance efflux pump
MKLLRSVFRPLFTLLVAAAALVAGWAMWRTYMLSPWTRDGTHSPVDGWVTNLSLRQGDYAIVGQRALSLVDANSFWVEGYFEETTIAPIAGGDPASVWLMGFPQEIKGHVDSLSRAINVPNAQANATGVAEVNPVFTWVRLAQRVPVRIHLDVAPEGVRLVQGMTATVQVHPRASEGRAQ